MDRDRSGTEGRRLIRPVELIWIGAVLAACAVGLLFLYRPWSEAGDVVAQISCGGTVVREISLQEAEDQTFVLPENPNVSFQIKDHSIRFADTDCPDHLCERADYLSRPNQVAICLPNQVSLKILGAGGEVDAIVD